MTGIIISILVMLAVAALAVLGPVALRKAQPHTAPNDVLVNCHCSAPDCGRAAYLNIEILLSDQTIKQSCTWGIEPTRCPDHRIPATQEGTA